jgi:hypothetical protein
MAEEMNLRIAYRVKLMITFKVIDFFQSIALAGLLHRGLELLNQLIET